MAGHGIACRIAGEVSVAMKKSPPVAKEERPARVRGSDDRTRPERGSPVKPAGERRSGCA